jgi:small GTP-binding protein
MPANLPPTYYEKERELKYAQSPQEKIQIYLELLAIMPKHKGTDKLKADLRSRISKLKKEIGKKTGVSRVDFYHVPKEGAAQVVMLGKPNTGKSQILKTLTNAEPEVKAYPFTTQKPQIGMIQYENIQIQLVDMPPISEDYAPGWIFGIARSSDLLLLVIDLKRKDIKVEIESLLTLLESARIKPAQKTRPRQDEECMVKNTIFVCNKEDVEESENRFTIVSQLYSSKYPILSISAKKNTGIGRLRKHIFESLGIIRVYTKPPHKDVDKNHPYVIKKGSKVIELASQIHRDFSNELRYVRLWRGNKYKGMRIDRDQVLEDEDVVEFHTK